MNYYDQQGLESFSYCLVTMRRNPGQPNWVRMEETPERFAGAGGDDILNYYETQDYLNSLDNDSQMLDERFRISKETRLDLKYQPTPDGLAVQHTKIHRVQGAVFHDPLDTNVTGLVLRCDGNGACENYFRRRLSR